MRKNYYAVCAFVFSGSERRKRRWILDKACRNLFVSVGMALADQEYEEEETSKVNPYTIYTVVNEMQKRRIKEGSHEF